MRSQGTQTPSGPTGRRARPDLGVMLATMSVRRRAGVFTYVEVDDATPTDDRRRARPRRGGRVDDDRSDGRRRPPWRAGRPGRAGLAHRGGALQPRGRRTDRRGERPPRGARHLVQRAGRRTTTTICWSPSTEPTRRSRHSARVSQLKASWIAAQTRSDVHGMSMWVTPRWETASTTAFWIAGVEPIVPDSPMPLAPSGLRGLSVWVFDVSKLHSSAADGIA